ncbi:MAG: hypothetical protein AAF226_06935 [Verrucomicrobiota bacterium]
MAVLVILVAMAAPSFLLLKPATLTAEGDQFEAFCKLVRSEAIANRTVYRIGFVVESDNADEVFRRYASWRWDKISKTFVQDSDWKQLADHLVFESSHSDYFKGSRYAQNEPHTVRGKFLLSGENGETFEVVSRSEITRVLRYVSFTPSGRPKPIDDGTRHFSLIIRPVSEGDAKSEIKNWIQLNIDTLTGRTQSYRP